MKTLILYYSYGGNTRGIAKKIQELSGGDLEEIKTAMPYDGDYQKVVEQGQQEVDAGYEPELQPLAVDLSGYDTIILGTPVWWYTFAPAVKTLLSSQNWAGKTIYPFATNGGWLGHTFQDIEKACAGADVRRGLNIKFDGTKQATPQREVEDWTRRIGKPAGETDGT